VTKKGKKGKKATAADGVEADPRACRARRLPDAPAGDPGCGPPRVEAGKNKKGKGKGKRAKIAAKPPKVFNCRGCCCGTRKKHPGVDASLLSKVLKEGARAAGADYRRTGCLGPCGQGNIVVVRAAGRTRWFRKMDDEDTTLALMDHLVDSGNVIDLPEALRRRVMTKREGRKPRD
jgi:(2Fe-2S) ferredoxin